MARSLLYKLRFLVAALLTFSISLLLSTYGPLSDNASRGHHVLMSAILTTVTTSIIWISDRRAQARASHIAQSNGQR